MKKQNGFTLIELMIVIGIISILSTLALPSFQDRVIRAQTEEAFNLAEIAMTNIEEYYKARHKMPKNNKEAGLPAANKIIGNYVNGVSIDGGAIHISLGNRVNKNVFQKTVTVRPAIVKTEPVVPISWIYGFASVPEGMQVIGENKTDLLPRHLPIYCRF